MEYKNLKEITTKIASGSTPRGGKNSYTDNGPIALIRSQNIYNNNFTRKGLAYINNEQAKKLENVEIHKDDILINITGDSVARVTMVDSSILPARVNQHVMIIRPEESKVNKYYLLAYLSSNTVQKTLIHLASDGATRPALTKRDLETFKIPNLTFKTQEYIGNLLKYINEKIEVNKKVIVNLEGLSQTLFKRWFVDFEFPNKDSNPYKSSGGEMVDSELGEIPKEWQVVKLETLIDNIKDRINAKSVSSNFPYVPIDLIPKRKLTFYNYKDGKEAKSSLIKFKRNDILLGNMRVYFHRVCLAPFEGLTRNTVFTLRPKNEKYTYYLIHLINKDEFIEYASNNSKGSTMPYAVWEGVLDKIKVIKPPLNYLNQFNSKIKNNFELSISLLEQNRKLATLRDTLLPKLMSGEIEIPDDIEVNMDELSI
ncbi:restriction endonuclease subunit S [Staphylococcus epidermidis]|uniref:restriction endonuclease subunit S n=1 Tax=Staphylococcus epidermidis TaxID=1282 RepID=UPI00266CF6C4|nr:restriction endonuclease subunit S [Staphylococcus epidermidis]MDO2944596.1 restriction endonuclease subunit S [Staphylococcus epidermidis]